MRQKVYQHILDKYMSKGHGFYGFYDWVFLYRVHMTTTENIIVKVVMGTYGTYEWEGL